MPKQYNNDTHVPEIQDECLVREKVPFSFYREEYTCCWSSCTVLCKVGLCTYVHKVTIQLITLGGGLFRMCHASLRRTADSQHACITVYSYIIIMWCCDTMESGMPLVHIKHRWTPLSLSLSTQACVCMHI